MATALTCRALAVSAGLLCCSTGCLIVRHSTHTIREQEAIHPIRFESESAQTTFEAGVHELQARKDVSFGGVVAVPFICWLSNSNQLSDNAIYNDQESACDINGDGLITLEEAIGYRARVDERVASIDSSKPKADGGSSPPVAPTPTANRSNEIAPPPGLLH